jgi:PRC-barrel domain
MKVGNAIKRNAFFYLETKNQRSTRMTASTTTKSAVDNRRETVSLIGSDKVEGTPVYGRDERKIGTLQRVMIDKISGKVAYAVISFGGFLGIGEDYYPIPWMNLKYDSRVSGYVVGVTEEQLRNAPKFTKNTEWDWADRSRDRDVYGYYGDELWY